MPAFAGAGVTGVGGSHPSLPPFVIKHGEPSRPPIKPELSVTAKLSFSLWDCISEGGGGNPRQRRHRYRW